MDNKKTFWYLTNTSIYSSSFLPKYELIDDILCKNGVKKYFVDKSAYQGSDKIVIDSLTFVSVESYELERKQKEEKKKQIMEKQEIYKNKFIIDIIPNKQFYKTNYVISPVDNSIEQKLKESIYEMLNIFDCDKAVSINIDDGKLMENENKIIYEKTYEYNDELMIYCFQRINSYNNMFDYHWFVEKEQFDNIKNSFIKTIKNTTYYFTKEQNDDDVDGSLFVLKEPVKVVCSTKKNNVFVLEYGNFIFITIQLFRDGSVAIDYDSLLERISCSHQTNLSSLESKMINMNSENKILDYQEH